MTPEQAFWDWFVANESRLFAFEHDQERIFDELHEQLQRVNLLLGFACGPVKLDWREFIITAGGRKEAFRAVTRLFQAVPFLARWQVIAFHPRTGPLARTTLNGLTLHADDMLFTTERDGEMVDIDLYLPDQLLADRSAIMPLVYLMLDGTLGEYDVETRIGAIDLRPASLARDAGARPFDELPQAVDALGPVATMH